MTEPSRPQTAEGGCFCSAVRYRIIGPPLLSIICHCNTCRRTSSAPSVGWLTVNRGCFELLGDPPQQFTSSPGVERTFCAKCGSPITYVSTDDPDTVDITTLSLDHPELFPPSREMWLEHRVQWESSNKSLRQYLRDSSDGPYHST